MRSTCLIILLLLVPSLVFADVYYVHKDGNDANDGSSWALAKESGRAVFDSYDINGDTIIVGGDINAGVTNSCLYAESGEDGVTFIDSLFYENWDSWTVGNTDTTKFAGSSSVSWSSGYAFLSQGGSNCKFYGIHFIGRISGQNVLLNTGTPDGIKFYNCTFTNNANNYFDLFATGAGVTGNIEVSFYNCRFLTSEYNVQDGIRTFSTGAEVTLNVYNCTFYGDFIFSAAIKCADSEGTEWNIHNSIIQNTSSLTADYIFSHVYPEAFGSHSLDYNIYYSGLISNQWYWQADINGFSVWQDSLQNYDINNEVNSLYQDPDLLYTTTTCVPNTPVTCSDLGYGTTIGWFQFPVASTDILNRIIIVQ